MFAVSTKDGSSCIELKTHIDLAYLVILGGIIRNIFECQAICNYPVMEPGQEVYIVGEQRSWLIGRTCKLVSLCHGSEWLVTLKSPVQLGVNVFQQVIIDSSKFATASILNGYYMFKRTQMPCLTQRWYCSLRGLVYEVHGPNLNTTMIGNWIYDQTTKQIKVELINGEILSFSPVFFGFATNEGAWLWYDFVTDKYVHEHVLYVD